MFKYVFALAMFMVATSESTFANTCICKYYKYQNGSSVSKIAEWSSYTKAWTTESCEAACQKKCSAAPYSCSSASGSRVID